MPSIYRKRKRHELTLEDLPVRDGSRKVYIHITLHDAKTGQKDAANCAAAKHPPWRGQRSKAPQKRKRRTPHIVKEIRERAPLWGLGRASSR